ncbi:LPXTG cell wall anchor domain-containing protein [Lentzea nigeriaca]|uniref:LPXTG cell wall anchor domain-containing protein n=1 Tax=Lentzea nigeriaca TaxID=1128665 RepID=UPI00195D7981|nr:LPXTG cell wall anchor domain-containing protein [Lentzea nigeriaca]MBM7856742.1 LPXTG-motif cell wall-anchored protein [Lentzea nigeriaca]
MARRVLGAFVVAGTTVLASLALATPASAHTPVVKASCDEKTQKSSLNVDLKWYGPEKKNTLEVFIDDVKQDHKVTFGDSHNETGWESDGKSEHVYKVSIKAYDDPGARNGWTKEITLDKTAACVKKAPPTKSTPPSETTTKTTTTTTEAPSSSVTPPAPGGSTPEPPLAATGASPLWLLLSGLGLVGAGAGTLLFLRRRRSA